MGPMCGRRGAVCSAVIQPTRTGGGRSARARWQAARCKSCCVSPLSSRRMRRCSLVAPDGPAAAPRLAVLKQVTKAGRGKRHGVRLRKRQPLAAAECRGSRGGSTGYVARQGLRQCLVQGAQRCGQVVLGLGRAGPGGGRGRCELQQSRPFPTSEKVTAAIELGRWDVRVKGHRSKRIELCVATPLCSVEAFRSCLPCRRRRIGDALRDATPICVPSPPSSYGANTPGQRDNGEVTPEFALPGLRARFA